MLVVIVSPLKSPIDHVGKTEEMDQCSFVLNALYFWPLMVRFTQLMSL